MLDDMDRVYFAHKIRDAQERARSAKDERSARPFVDLVAEYSRKLSELPTKASA
jgi:hypothetical protein